MTISPGQSQETPRRGQFQGRIAGADRFGDKLRSLTVALTGAGAAAFRQARPGQFVQLSCRDLHDGRCASPLLRRPLSIAGIHQEGPNPAASDPSAPTGTKPTQRAPGDESVWVEFLFRVQGPGTGWLSRRALDEPLDLLGPLGNGFRLPTGRDRRAILIGGGVGLPPMFFLADVLSRAGQTDIVAFAGARTVSQFVGTLCLDRCEPASTLMPLGLLEQFNRCGVGCVLATDDGSRGFAGSVVEAVEEFLAGQPKPARTDLYACGPKGMLRAVARLAERRDLACQVCMEAYMACGIGLCQSCVVPVRSADAGAADAPHYKLVCSQGPVFDARTICWD
ncbi:MAG: dihydroorotate dehydrogenase electron transfer subunit [Sedimentisphaerales bacterium]|nr:dihydroorotate dehydrogenase electron transfer subunit [Sedimentisphaerales bacterium]